MNKKALIYGLIRIQAYNTIITNTISFNSKDNAKLVRTIANNVGNVYIHLSNIFDSLCYGILLQFKNKSTIIKQFYKFNKIQITGKKVMIAYVDHKDNTTSCGLMILRFKIC